MEIHLVLALILSLQCLSMKASSIYQRQDFLTIKDPFETENNANGPYHFSFRPNSDHSQANAFTGSKRQNNTTMMDEKLCYTTEGRIGSCISLRLCYPTSKVPQLNNLQIWTTITRRACSYAVNDGRQTHGICCSNEGIFNPPSVFVDVRTMPIIPPFDVPLSFPYPVIPYPMAVSANIKVSSKSEDPLSSPLTEMSERKLIGCGVGPAKISSHHGDRIVGGTDAVKNSWPEIVALKYAGSFFCSGTLISPNKILTAAYCARVYQPWDLYLITVELGAHTMYPDSDAPVSRRISGFSRHRSYDSTKPLNDIAIFMLKVPVIYSKTMSPICLPAAGTADTYADQDAVIIGWGSVENEQDPFVPANVLQQANLKIISNADCQTSYNDLGLGVTIEDSMICIQTPDKATCYGDNGGPLLVRSSPTAPWTQVGIITTSRSVVCSSPEIPKIYTRVSSFSSWISARI